MMALIDEAKNINKSLSALGNVISALAEGNVSTATLIDEAKNVNKSLSALGNVISALAEGNVSTGLGIYEPRHVISNNVAF